MEKSKIIREELSRVISRLASRQKEALFLHFCAGFTFGEVAELLDLTMKVTYKLIVCAVDTCCDQLDSENAWLLKLYLLQDKS